MALRRERVLLLVLLAAVIVVWWLALGAGPSDLTVTVLDVGQGDSIVVQSPSGRNLLIDGGGRVGESTGGYDVGRDVVVPALMARGVRKLDVLVITHPHEDHTGGLSAVVQQVPVGLVLDPMPAEQTSRQWLVDELRHDGSVWQLLFEAGLSSAVGSRGESA